MDYKKIIINRSIRLRILKLLSFIPDSVMLKIQYRIKQGYSLDLQNPKRFTEKIQWLKLNNRKDIYHVMVDKARVKDYVAGIIGEQYIIPSYGIWYSFEDIDFDSLPEQFVLKTNTGGGGLNVVICKSKKDFNKEEARKKLVFKPGVTKKSSGREWPYENIKKCIIAEAYMQNNDDEELVDYKFYCFSGEPYYCQVISGRNSVETIDFYDMQWQHQEFIGLNPRGRHSVKNADAKSNKPATLSQMIEIARKLSHGQPFLRVDLYQVDNKVYFGEMTFFPASGFGTFRPDEWDYKLGDLIKLNDIYI